MLISSLVRSRSAIGIGARRAFSRKRNVKPQSLIKNFDSNSEIHCEVKKCLLLEIGCTEREAERAVGSWGHRPANCNKVEHVDAEAIGSRIEALRTHLLLDEDETRYIILRMPSILGLDLDARLEPLLGVLKSRLNLPLHMQLKNLVLRWPALLGLRWENFGTLQGGLVENLKFNNHSIEHLHESLDLDAAERRGTNRIVNMLNQMDEEDTGSTLFRSRIVDPRKRTAFLDDGSGLD